MNFNTPFLNVSTLVAAVAAALQMPVSQLSTNFYNPLTGLGIIPSANLKAYKDIRGALLQRTFSNDQILQWDRGTEFNLDIGVYWSLVDGAGLHAYDLEAVKLRDRRKELSQVLVETSSGTTQPPNDTPLAAMAGALYESPQLALYLREKAAGQGLPACGPCGPGVGNAGVGCGGVSGAWPFPPYYGGCGPY